ncbi:cytochrome c [Rhizobium sp. P44RR-XXIV]|uniref:cytochrome c n=1 Tax=Rhizobium sp. P44RR-XXIV TaxID=1921145 RepID=UPI000984EB07|nr:cytochrome c [Rhizobium sp. P44RR-XXIV]TIX93119.1 cytochrome c [Rhizobium sp. P44RR-XXIV]
MKYALPIRAVLSCLAFASAVAAAQDIVALRQADMKAIAAAAKTISGMFKEPTTYSSLEFKQAADTIRDKSGEVLIGHFSEITADPRSRATPDIVEERDRFDRLANDLTAYASALSTAAVENPQAMSDSMRMKPGEPMGGGPLGIHVRSEATLSSIPAEHVFHLMLQTCATCHSRFRMD